jgi:O-acetyl-ADP-ribose deacetylase (regulator of RNase III)
MEESVFFAGRLRVVRGDITDMKVDAVVNAANSSLLGGGGVDGAIHRRGGPEILAECRRLRASRFPGGLPAGQAVATTAGRLPARLVIHTVGPVWQGGGAGEPELLASCYRASLAVAAEQDVRTIAFPAISTGVYGYPKAAAARVACSAIKEFLDGAARPEIVTLVFFSAADRELFIAESGCGE